MDWIPNIVPAMKLSAILPLAALFVHVSITAIGADQPNIVLIFADDLGYGDVGCYGATKVSTPNIDRLAAQGRRFTDAHSASAVCSPSRYALLTGEYPLRANLWAPLFAASPLAIAPEKTTLATLLKRQGYATACIGKWHLGFGDKPRPDWNRELKPGPLELGFDYYFGLPVLNSHCPFVLVENRRVLGLDLNDPLVYGGVPETRVFPEKMLTAITAVSGGKAAHARYNDEQLGTVLAEKAIDWIRQHRNRPFFLYFATPQIHHPFTPHPRFQGTSECGRYGDFIHELDWMVGELMRTLDELKLANNTLVIFTSDNGGMLNQGGQDAWRAGHRQNGQLLGFKFDAWEGGHRVPFIARWPGKIEPDSTSDQLLCNVDMLATLAAVAGAALEPAEAPDSFNLLPALTGAPKKPVRDHLIIAPFHRQNLAIREGHWMYIGAQGGGGFGGNNIGDHTFGGPPALHFAGQKNSDIEQGRLKPDAPKAQLYDLRSDPSQALNVIDKHPALARRLADRLAELVQSSRSAPVAQPEP